MSAADMISWTDGPHMLAVDAKGYVWRCWPDETWWSMAPVNPDNSPVPEPVTYYAPVGVGSAFDPPWPVTEAQTMIEQNLRAEIAAHDDAHAEVAAEREARYLREWQQADAEIKRLRAELDASTEARLVPQFGRHPAPIGTATPRTLAEELKP